MQRHDKVVHPSSLDVDVYPEVVDICSVVCGGMFRVMEMCP